MLPYRSEAEQFDAIRPLVRDGLRSNDRVLYVGSPSKCAAALEAFGADVRQAVSSGQVELEDSGAAYVHGGRFDARWTKEQYGNAVRRAFDDGYDGLCVAADMTWAADAREAIDALIDYERSLDAIVEDAPVIAVCQYDRRLFDEITLARLIHAHTLASVPNAVVNTSILRIERTYDPLGLRATGEIDASNRNRLIEALTDIACDAQADIVLDFSGVSYMDAAAMTALAFAPRRIESAATIRVRLSPAMQRIFAIAWSTLPHDIRLEEFD